MTLSIGGCSSAKTNTEAPAAAVTDGADATIRRPAPAPRPAYMPRTVIYKTNGDYNNNVTVVVTPDSKSLVTFPAPGDVGQQSVPVAVADGWLWDRRGGIGPDTRFLTYTYDEYHALQQAPSVDDLMRAIIPEARVTAAYRLPLPIARATAEAVDSIIADGLNAATPIVP